MSGSCNWCSLLTWSAQLAGIVAQLAVALQRSAKGSFRSEHLTPQSHALWNALGNRHPEVSHLLCRYEDSVEEPPPIRIVVAEGAEDVTIKVRCSKCCTCAQEAFAGSDSLLLHTGGL